MEEGVGFVLFCLILGSERGWMIRWLGKVSGCPKVWRVEWAVLFACRSLGF